MRLFRTALLCVVIATPAVAQMHGAWTATSDSPNRVHLFLTTGQWMQFGQSFDLAQIGLSPSIVNSTTSTPSTIRLDRDAGTLVLEGTFKNGDGAGQFTFTPNRRYLEAVRSMGVANDLASDRSEAEQLFTLAVNDLSLAYIRSIRTVFSDATLRDLRRARSAGLTPDYVASMRRAGIEINSVHDAARLAAVEVTPDYIRSLRDAGVDVHDAHDAMRLRAVNVTPQFVAELAAAGYKNLSVRELTRAAASGVDGDFVRRMSKYKDKNK